MRIALICLLAMAALSGCTNARPPEAIRLGPKISDLEMTLELHDATGADEYYTIRRDGSFGFGGGMSARLDKTIWTTQLTTGEMQALVDLLIQQGWFDDQVHSTRQPKDAWYEIEATCDAGRLHKRIIGVSDRVEPVRAVCKEIANRRLQPDLDRQPRPSVERQPATTQPQ